MPWIEAWRPGLTADAIVELTQRHRLRRLPPELVVWWGWRDGTRTVTRDGRTTSVVVNASSFVAWPLEFALRQTAELRARIVDVERQVPDGPRSWITEGDRWFGIGNLAHGAVVYADLEASPRGASEVRCVENDAVFDSPRQGVPSMGTLIEWWAAALDDDIHRWDPHAQQWVRGARHPPHEQRRTGLV